jgi:hypothetical protein
VRPSIERVMSSPRKAGTAPKAGVAMSPKIVLARTVKDFMLGLQAVEP